MEGVKEKAAVKRVIAALADHGLTGEYMFFQTVLAQPKKQPLL